MKTLTPREVATQWFERVWQQRSREAIFELLHAEGIGHLEGGRDVHGPKQFAEFHDSMLTAFPDMEVQILRVVADEDHACLHWRVDAVHRGDFLGIIPTNIPVFFSGTTYLSVKDGQIVEGWDSWNQSGLIHTIAQAAGG